MSSTQIIVALFVLLIVGALIFLRYRKKKRGRVKLKKDPIGVWKYHAQTVFERKLSYGAELEENEKKSDKNGGNLKSVAVIKFDGDIRARSHGVFASLVDEIEVNREEFAEVVVILSSPGGLVAPYGHASYQMERVRNLGLELTVCVDTVAASGGYLMSLPATKIIAAPFAIVGSVGVLAFVPNIRQMLMHWHVNPRTFTAGKYKQTIGLTDQATQEDVDYFRGQLNTIHQYFLKLVTKYRPQAKMDEVETGAHWTAQESVDRELGLVDELGTSQDYLLKKNKENDLIFLSQTTPFLEGKFGRLFTMLSEQIVDKLNQVHLGY